MRSEPWLIDTSGWIALLNSRESSHVLANQIWRDFGRGGGIAVVTDWVVAETGNGLGRRSSRELFVTSLRAFSASPKIRMVYVDADLSGKAVDLYDYRPDKGWGLVDCASFIVMRKEGIHSAFASDHHFEQAGFSCLLPGPHSNGTGH